MLGTHVTVNAAAEALKPEPVHLALMPQPGLAPDRMDKGNSSRADFEKVMGTHMAVNAAAEALKPEPVHLALITQTGLEQRPEDAALSA